MNKQRVGEWFEKGAVGLIGVIASVIVTALLKGEPLSGLSKATVFWKTLNSPAIPVWLFALALIGLFFSLQGWSAVSRDRKRALHVFWHQTNSFWHLGGHLDRPAMQIIAEATFTGREVHPIQVLSARLEGGTTKMDLMEPVICTPEEPVRESIMFFVMPPLAEAGKPWTGRIILVDQYNREYRSPKLILEHR